MTETRYKMTKNETGADARIGVNMKQGRKLFWGLMFILGALALIIGKMGFLEGFSFWGIVFSIALIGILVDGIFHRSWGMILFSIAFFIIVNDEFLGLESITPWPVLGAALLGTIGLKILFPGKWKGFGSVAKARKWNNGEWSGKMIVDGEEKNVLSGEDIWFSNSFGESVKYLGGNEVKQVHLENSFGSLTVYFDNVLLKEGNANVYVDNSFGSMILYIPGDWRVVTNLDVSCGDAKEQGCSNAASENTIHLYGDVSFGDLEVRYL